MIYAGKNLYLPTSFGQDILQGHILVIPDTDASTGLFPLLTPPSSAGPTNAQQRVVRIKLLLSMGQDRLSKEEAGKLLGQRVHILTSTQELRHSTRNFVKLTGNYLGEYSPLCLLMATWPRHIDHFERKYYNAFAKDPLFGADLIDRIHKRVQVLLYSCNTTSIEDVELVALAEFGGLQKKVEIGDWITTTPV